MSARPFLRLLASLLVAGCAAVALPANACTLVPSVTSTSGPFSPAAVKAAAVPAQSTRAGLTCDPSLVVLLGGTYIRATLRSTNGYKLLRTGGGGSIDYVASADAAGSYRFTTAAPTIDYMQNNLLNLLGLLGGSSADLPFFVKPSSGVLPPVGSYTDRVTIDWSWYLCPGGVSILGGLCLGRESKGVNQRATVDVTLTVAARSVTVAVTSVIVWDPANEANNPKDLPGSRRRVALGIANPDLVALDAGTLALVLPTPPRTLVALDGDGVSTGAAIRMTEGAPASGVAIRYDGPSSTTDDVDFSADSGASWAFVPVAGDSVSQGRVTHVRVRPRGAMAPSSSFSVSVPFLVR